MMPIDRNNQSSGRHPKLISDELWAKLEEVPAKSYASQSTALGISDELWAKLEELPARNHDATSLLTEAPPIRAAVPVESYVPMNGHLLLERGSSLDNGRWSPSDDFQEIDLDKAKVIGRYWATQDQPAEVVAAKARRTVTLIDRPHNALASEAPVAPNDRVLSSLEEARRLSPRGDYWFRVAKRTLDLMLAPTMLIVIAPVLLMATVAVRLTSEGPVLFRQRRIGEGGEPFTILKFRTMYADADSSLQRAFDEAETRGELDEFVSNFTFSTDPRLTSVGSFLRRYSIDELPQLWNVIRGDMSLVGPRPSCDWEVELFGPRFAKRLTVQPGLTGLWQVARTSEVSDMLDLDIRYATRRSLALDLAILVRTIPAVLFGTAGRHGNRV